MIENKEIKINELMKHIKGPDFPTGGIIIGKNIIKEGYKNGRGSFKIRGEIVVENLKMVEKDWLLHQYHIKLINLF